MPANPSTDLLLITCASGKQSTALLPLLSTWKHLRLAVHSASSATRLRAQWPHAEVIQTDLYSPSNCSSLLKDVSIVLHIGPSYHPHEAAIGTMMIDAAAHSHGSGTGVLKHFILSSVLNTQLRKMMNHDCKRVVEEALMESGLPYTILQPTTFMDNLPLQAFIAQDEPAFTCGWNPDIKFSWLTLSDLAAVMYTVLLERESHFFAQYPLVSTRAPLSFKEVLGIVSERIGKEIRVLKAPFEQAVENLCKRLYGTVEGVDARSRDAAMRMILYYDSRGLVGSANVLEWVLRREGCTVEEWVERAMEGR
ncbi:hypothetical protein BCR34DRAFT_553785 [Clohesyomyces aquaticus]|uniref:NmrA-like domain-containing protein n=1 Tax=Clohesyomyces aquaticus TaxID=1231657 RepID=A0A1Y2A7L0_9PLEO|nr:hypothetical protein BCR34DRAFT_553785 [Clohesyomyces aquaticus]